VRIAVALVALFAAGCSSTLVRFGDAGGPIAPGARGRSIQAGACGFQLLLLIPIGINSRALRAYRELQLQAAGGAITDVNVAERWFYAFVGTGYCTQLSATVYPKG
jgi:hypothetical protein